MNPPTDFQAASNSVSSLVPLSRLIIDLTSDSEPESELARELDEMFGSDSDSDNGDLGSFGFGVNVVPGCGCDHCVVAPQPADPLMLLTEEDDGSVDLEGVEDMWPMVACLAGIDNDSDGGGGVGGSDGGGGDNSHRGGSDSHETLFSAGGGGGINIGDVASGSAGGDWEWSRIEAAPFYTGSGGEGGRYRCGPRWRRLA